MIRILKESFQDVSEYLRSSELKEGINNEYPSIKNDPGSVEYGVNDYVIDSVQERFPDDVEPQRVQVIVIKVQGDETEVITSDHEVVEFNGVLYDYTAHQFSDSFNNQLSFNIIPVTQQVVTNENQINEGISSVKYYAMLKA